MCNISIRTRPRVRFAYPVDTRAMSSPLVLVVEDDAQLGTLLQEFLSAEGLRVEIETRGDRAVNRIRDLQPDLVVLDIGLPGLDGLDVLRRSRAAYGGRVLILTARRTDADQIEGLELGADDYVTKPVDPRVLRARILALLRRGAGPLPGAASLQVGPLQIDRGSREIRVGEVLVPVTSTEFELAWVLVQFHGQVVTRDRLYETVRGIAYDGLDRGIDIHVSRLRRKFREAGLAGDPVKSLRGTGYQLAIAR